MKYLLLVLLASSCLLPAAERGFGFRLGRLQGAANVLPGMHHAHPAPAAAGRRFHDDGEPD